MTDVYGAFSDLLRRAQGGELDVLGEEEGLLARWGTLCEEQLQALSADLDADETDIWTLERNTWALVQALYSERLSDAPAEPSSSKNPYTPPLTVIQRLIEGNKDLIELSAIRDWLHSIPSSLNPAEIRRGYLPYTKNKLKQLKRTGQRAPQGLVEELDPDALVRAGGAEKGARLEADDAAYERALLRSLYEYVRAGELDLAIDMCRQSDQAWRAASLSGGKLWWDPALAPGEAGYEEEEGGVVVMETERRSAQGNLNRRLWKKMCRRIAESSAVDPYERALYGALSGDVSSVLPVCATWEDIVWAHLNSLFEAHIEAGLSVSLSGRYWQRGSVAPVDPKAALNAEDELLAGGATTKPIRQELESVFERLTRSDKPDLAAAAKNPFHLSQAYLIVGKINQLIETFVERLESAAPETEPETLAHLLRFFAHLILALRLLKQPLPSYAANRILEAYVKVLEANDQDESLVAFYASALERQSAVESYAGHLLTAFGPQHDLATRHAALLSARTHGLSLSAIALRTVELLLSDTLASLPLPPSSTSLAGLNAFGGVSQEQERLVWGVEWLLMEKETYEEGLRWSNALGRWFLSTDSPPALRLLLSRLPADLLPTLASAAGEGAESTQAVQLDIREHLDYVALFKALESQGRWREGWASGVGRGGKSASKLDRAQFRDTVAALVDDFYTAAVELLEGEWLKLEGLDGTVDAAASRRHSELAKIRRLVIPDIVFRLHQALYETREVLPSNLARCLSLANLVADERYQLYLEFLPAEGEAEGPLGLKKYLEEVAKASLASLEVGKGPFGVEEGK
ncbi:hypothetical protein JCM6882_003958 [Rhodosporidiobolus microsporus]